MNNLMVIFIFSVCVCGICMALVQLSVNGYLGLYFPLFYFCVYMLFNFYMVLIHLTNLSMDI